MNKDLHNNSYYLGVQQNIRIAYTNYFFLSVDLEITFTIDWFMIFFFYEMWNGNE